MTHRLLVAGCSCTLVGAGPASLLAPLSSSCPFPSVAPSLSQCGTCPGLGWLERCGFVFVNYWIFWKTPQEVALNLCSVDQRLSRSSPCWCWEKVWASPSVSKLEWCGRATKSQRMSFYCVCVACYWLRKQLFLAHIWAWVGTQMLPWGSSSCFVFFYSSSGSFYCSVSWLISLSSPRNC